MTNNESYECRIDYNEPMNVVIDVQPSEHRSGTSTAQTTDNTTHNSVWPEFPRVTEQTECAFRSVLRRQTSVRSFHASPPSERPHQLSAAQRVGLTDTLIINFLHSVEHDSHFDAVVQVTALMAVLKLGERRMRMLITGSLLHGDHTGRGCRGRVG